eukprot:TRINITY_DN14182_c0_g1_i1.p1 TRINITY_DN14182_c0_g1~~TRINITY_DN14182_c0_g1_i1.p1  ORF type:complete len:257 (-),score=75.13 TRINITY_DN14182_c0_g1_i1:24-794(-)
MVKLDGSTFFVTGGASGLGESTCRFLTSQGANVVIADLNEDRGNDLVKELAPRAIYAQVDVTNEDSVKAAIKLALEKFGKLHGAVNCAGVAMPERTVSSRGVASLIKFNKIMEINVGGTFNVIRLVAEVLSKQEPDANGERGVFVNTASVAAFDGQIGQASYSASKGAVVSMTLPLAREFGNLGIRICTIAPGVFDTPMFALLPDAARQKLAKDIPFPRKLGAPEDFARLAAHIITNNYLNGETIRLDGALRMAAM